MTTGQMDYSIKSYPPSSQTLPIKLPDWSWSSWNPCSCFYWDMSTSLNILRTPTGNLIDLRDNP